MTSIDKVATESTRRGLGEFGGKVAIVTGGGAGIGYAIARAFAREGAHVAIAGRTKETLTRSAEAIERECGAPVLAVAADVAEPADCEGMIAETVTRFGAIDILVNNAALLGGRGVLDESAADFERAVRVTALGYFLNTKHVGQAMAERGIKGSIVCISSSNGWSGTAGIIAYAFHKGGVNNFVRAAAMDLAPYGIRVNSFTPTAPNPDNPELLAERANGVHGEKPGRLRRVRVDQWQNGEQRRVVD